MLTDNIGLCLFRGGKKGKIKERKRKKKILLFPRYLTIAGD